MSSIRFSLRLKRDFQEKNEEWSQSDDWELKIRTWFMSTYLLTPFDDRYLRTPFEWMEFMFLNFMNSPPYETIRSIYQRNKFESKKLDESGAKEQLADGGYSDEDTEKIMKAFEAAAK